jgi:N-acyl amino acid synthase of PEP-CTERM/exosortase system
MLENGRDFRRKCEHQLVRGLYVSLYRESKLRGLTHWFTVMAKGLYVILKRWGISFVQIGPARDYHGIRAPYLISIESIERSLQRNDPALFFEAQNGLLH